MPDILVSRIKYAWIRSATGRGDLRRQANALRARRVLAGQDGFLFLRKNCRSFRTFNVQCLQKFSARPRATTRQALSAQPETASMPSASYSPQDVLKNRGGPVRTSGRHGNHDITRVEYSTVAICYQVRCRGESDPCSFGLRLGRAIACPVRDGSPACLHRACRERKQGDARWLRVALLPAMPPPFRISRARRTAKDNRRHPAT